MINKHEREIKQIIEIGKSGICGIDSLHYFLPIFPELTGNEIVCFNFSFLGLSLDDIEYLVKGMHYIELEYRKRTGIEFGFGSPSKTNSLIYRISKIDIEKAKELQEWIANNGGNYYIEKKEK